MIGDAARGGTPVWGLVAFLTLLAIQRVSELIHSAHHVERLKARGAREHGSAHFPLLVCVHVLFPVSLAAEVLALGARPERLWVMWLVLLLAAQVLRYSALWTLGERWTVGIWVLPGVPELRRGPYRFLRHPNYLAVVLELLAAPLMFGAWRTAIAIGVLNLFALRIRIRAEERALGGGIAASR